MPAKPEGVELVPEWVEFVGGPLCGGRMKADPYADIFKITVPRDMGEAIAVYQRIGGGKAQYVETRQLARRIEDD